METVAEIVRKRHVKACDMRSSAERRQLLKAMKKMEDAFVDDACRTLI